MWKIPLFDLNFGEEELNAVQQVIRSAWLTMGEQTERFEQAFAEFLNVKYAYAVSSGTAALHLAFAAIGIGQGDNVICPSLTFVAGANAILYTGAKPVFADISSIEDFNISPDEIKAKITEDTKAIEIVHYGGYSSDMDRILGIAKQYNLYVIEDCAHAPGSEYHEKKCGTIGDIGCFSFFSNKNMTTAEGGMITTNDDELAERIRLMRSHGMTTLTLDRHKGHAFSYDVVELGYNYRIDELRSAIGIAQLQKLRDANNIRKNLDRVYRERVKEIRELKVPFEQHKEISSHHISPVILDKKIKRNRFMQHLKERGIQTSIHYPPIHLFDLYRCMFGYQKGILPITEEVAAREVTLPLYPQMSEESVQYVCDTIVEFFNE